MVGVVGCPARWGVRGSRTKAAMRDEVPDLCTATVEGDFVVFLIGVRIAKPWEGLPPWTGGRRDAADAGGPRAEGAPAGTEAARERVG